MNNIDRQHRSDRSSPLDPRHLVAFRAVAAEASFTRAAARLGYVQSTITAQVQSLERDLDTRLFERLGHTVHLTESGQRLLEHVDELLELTARARHAASGREPSTLSVGAPDTLCAYRLPAILQRFRLQHPDVRVSFRPTRSSASARQAVIDGAVDVALMLDEEIDERQLTIELLAPERLAFLTAPDHPLAQGAALRLQDLAGQDMVLTEAGCGYRTMLEGRLRSTGTTTGSVMEFTGLEAIKECVKVGMGLTFLPVMAVDRELRDGELVELPWRGPVLRVPVQLVRHRDKWLSPALSAFVEDVRGVVGAR